MLLDEQAIRAAEAEVKRWVKLWPADGPGPMGPDDLDAALAIAVAAADHISAVWDQLTDAIEATAGAVVYDLDSARAIQNMDLAWLGPTRRALDRLADLDRRGEPISHAARFRDLVTEAGLATYMPVERVAREAEWFARAYPDAVDHLPSAVTEPADAEHALRVRLG